MSSKLGGAYDFRNELIELMREEGYNVIEDPEAVKEQKEYNQLTKEYNEAKGKDKEVAKKHYNEWREKIRREEELSYQRFMRNRDQEHIERLKAAKEEDRLAMQKEYNEWARKFYEEWLRERDW